MGRDANVVLMGETGSSQGYSPMGEAGALRAAIIDRVQVFASPGCERSGSVLHDLAVATGEAGRMLAATHCSLEGHHNNPDPSRSPAVWPDQERLQEAWDKGLAVMRSERPPQIDRAHIRLAEIRAKVCAYVQAPDDDVLLAALDEADNSLSLLYVALALGVEDMPVTVLGLAVEIGYRIRDLCKRGGGVERWLEQVVENECLARDLEVDPIGSFLWGPAKSIGGVRREDYDAVLGEISAINNGKLFFPLNWAAN